MAVGTLFFDFAVPTSLSAPDRSALGAKGWSLIETADPGHARANWVNLLNLPPCDASGGIPDPALKTYIDIRLKDVLYAGGHTLTRQQKTDKESYCYVGTKKLCYPKYHLEDNGAVFEIPAGYPLPSGGTLATAIPIVIALSYEMGQTS